MVLWSHPLGLGAVVTLWLVSERTLASCSHFTVLSGVLEKAGVERESGEEEEEDELSASYEAWADGEVFLNKQVPRPCLLEAALSGHHHRPLFSFPTTNRN